MWERPPTVTTHMAHGAPHGGVGRKIPPSFRFPKTSTQVEVCVCVCVPWCASVHDICCADRRWRIGVRIERDACSTARHEVAAGASRQLKCLSRIRVLLQRIAA